MKRLAATTALLLALTACSSDDTSTPTPSPATTTSAAAVDDSPRGQARDVVRDNVPEWDDLTNEQLDAAASAACTHLDEHPDDVDGAVAGVALDVLGTSGDRGLFELQTAAGIVTIYAGSFDCTTHRDAVQQWSQTQIGQE